jgi:hypothetical protein
MKNEEGRFETITKERISHNLLMRAYWVYHGSKAMTTPFNNLTAYHDLSKT